jgi:iron complex transport system substrate-binding protein
MRKLLIALMLLAQATSVLAQLIVTDDRGISVSFARSPQRVVSLLPSLTESVCALGECRRLVGVDRYSNFPAPVRGLPRVGGGIDPNIEAVVALRPDVVLMATSAQGAQRLESLGLKVLALEPHTSADVQRVLQRLGQVLEVRDAQRVWREIDDGVTAAAKSLPPSARSQRVYYEVSRGPFAAGPDSFLGELLQRLGVGNVVPRELGPFPKINPEFVVKADPDVIMIGESEAQGLAQRPGWAGLRALRGGRVCQFNNEESDVLLRPGPRMAESARLLARCLSGGATKGRG